jgi:hypothetical protein
MQQRPLVFGKPCASRLTAAWQRLFNLMETTTDDVNRAIWLIDVSSGALLLRYGVRYEGNPDPIWDPPNHITLQMVGLKLDGNTTFGTELSESDWKRLEQATNEWLCPEIAKSWESPAVKKGFSLTRFAKRPFGVYFVNDFESVALFKLNWVAGNKLRERIR